MVLSEDKKKEYMKRLILSRMRILCNNGFYGLLLMHMIYSIDENCETAATDGRRIFFGPKFLDELNDTELDFVMMHEILHVVLQHCLRQGDRDNEQFNIACDIVVNSNILLSENNNLGAITLQKYGTSMHLAPDGKEGYEYTAEQVYEMLPLSKKGTGHKPPLGASWDDHSRWKGSEDHESANGYSGPNYEDTEYMKHEIEKWLIDAMEAISIRDSTKSFGGGPVFAQRLLKEIKKGQIDWREILNNFVQEEITDYSFTPPDRRFDDNPFFLPDFNEKEETIGNVWFVVDTSGSISDEAIKAAYSEICSAINQFNGKLSGMLSFTESYVTEPIPFSSVDELLDIKPIGGGGNDFSDIFRYMKNHMTGNLPSQVIIITDGYDTFPNEKAAMGIPVLWLINNDDESVKPPFGKVARIVV